MLGNIKFIGELGKLDMLHELILHRCIKQLLEKKKNQSVADMAEDVECLCQILQTVGRQLDHDKAKALMDQYFARMKNFMRNMELPPRIRFMLQDVVELRENKWTPRKTGKEQKPRTITEIRQDAVKDLGYFMAPPGSTPRANGFSDRNNMMDMFSGVPPGVLANSGIGTGPGVIHDDNFSGTGRFSPSMGNRGRNQNSPGYQYNNKRQDGNSPKQQRHMGKGGQQQQQQQQQQKQMSNGRDLPPRFQKKSNHQKGDGMDKMGVNEEISLRPAMKFTPMFKPGTPNMLPKSALAPPGPGPIGLGHSMPEPSMNPLLQKQQPITIKQVPAPDKSKKEAKKEKAPSKDELRELTASLLMEYLTSQDTEEAISRVKDMRAPRKYTPEMITYFMTYTLEKADVDRENANRLICEMKKENLVTSDQYMESFQTVVDKMKALEVDIPLVKSHIAKFAAYAVAHDVVPLVEMKEPMESGAYYPLFMLILQQLHKLKDEQWLRSTFNESKINLQDMLPEIDRNKERMMEILEDRGLSFMFPLLRVQNELWRYVTKEPSASAIYKWLKDNVDATLLAEPSLIYTVATVLFKYICQESTLAEGVDRTAVPDKAVSDKEKQLLSKYKGILQMLTNNDQQLQLTVLYALQVHCHANQFPKGLILRFFMYLYDMEIIDEDVFLRWKEEVNDEYPGKGKTLFQVHQWLTWLEQAEEESEDEGED